MAARLGVPEDVVRSARSRISEDDTRLETLLRQVEEDSRLLASEKERLEQERKAADLDRLTAGALLTAAKEEAAAVRAKGKAEAREVLSSLRQKLRDLSRSALLEQSEIKRTTAEVEALAKRLEPVVSREPQNGPDLIYDLHPGDRVKISSVNRTGTVLSAHHGVLEVEVGGKTVKFASRDRMLIEPVQQNPRTHGAPGWGAVLHEDEGSVDRINILGLRVDEGLAEVDRFIDRASATNLSIVTIIHGLGTGALKAAVNEFLKQHPLIAATRPGEPAEGGAGVTVAELKR